MSPTKVILAFVPDIWSEQHQSRHHVLRGLSEHYKVLWISPPTYVEGWRRDGPRASLEGRGLKKISNQFWTYASCLPADYKRNYTKQGLVARGFRLYHTCWQRAYRAKIKR